MINRFGPGNSPFYALLLFALVLALPFFAGTSAAQPAAGQAGEQPVEITSERMNADYGKGVIRFLGAVVARKGDVTIYSEELVLHLEQGEQGGQRVREIEAFKNVRIVQGIRVATGQAAKMDNDAQKVVLTGSPRVQEGKNFVEGDEITVFLNEDRSVAKSKPGSRTKAVFHPKEKGNAP
ncbi:MAG: lipopolysaccharide transport periplasmic protein LptA [Syntrophotaleaceae bacterium]